MTRYELEKLLGTSQRTPPEAPDGSKEPGWAGLMKFLLISLTPLALLLLLTWSTGDGVAAGFEAWGVLLFFGLLVFLIFLAKGGRRR